MPTELSGALEGWMLDLRGVIRDELRGLHLELIQELDNQVRSIRHPSIGRVLDISVEVCVYC